MQKRIKRSLLSLVGLAFLLAPVTVSAWTPFGGVDCTKAATSAVCTDDQHPGSNPLVGPNGALIRVTRIVAFLAGAAAIIVIVIGGLRYVMSNGDSNAITSARNSILYSLIGLVVIILAQAFIVFVVKRI